MRHKASKSTRPPPPEDLDGEALLEWQRACDELEADGQLAKTDRAILTLYVHTWATWQTARRHVEQFGIVVKFPNGYPGLSPFYLVAKDCESKLQKLLQDLGLTPSTRKPKGNADDIGELDI